MAPCPKPKKEVCMAADWRMIRVIFLHMDGILRRSTPPPTEAHPYSSRRLACHQSICTHSGSSAIHPAPESSCPHRSAPLPVLSLTIVKTPLPVCLPVLS